MKRPLLLVDDDQDTLESMRPLVQGQFRVLCAGPDNPVSAALRAWRENADLELAILDLHYAGQPESAGLDLLTQLKGERPSARIAIRSALQSHDNLADAIRAGADGYMGKKNWSRDNVLANINMLSAAVSAGVILRALAQRAEYRLPHAPGHSERTGKLCRAILIHLQEASPKSVDLAACLIAAELHELGADVLSDAALLGQHHPPALLAPGLVEQTVQFAAVLTALGPGFDKVKRIISLARNPNPNASLPPAPSEHVITPGGDDIPLEARVLRVADAIDTLLTSPPAQDLNTAMAIIRQDTELGLFDLKVTRALEQLIAHDRGRLEAIYPSGSFAAEVELALYFAGQRLTAFQLQICLALFNVLYLRSGVAANRLTVVGVETVLIEGKGMVKVRLLGTEEETRSAQELLEKMRAEDKAPRTNPLSLLAHRADLTIGGPYPDRIERTTLTGSAKTPWTVTDLSHR